MMIRPSCCNLILVPNVSVSFGNDVLFVEILLSEMIPNYYSAARSQQPRKVSKSKNQLQFRAAAEKKSALRMMNLLLTFLCYNDRFVQFHLLFHSGGTCSEDQAWSEGLERSKLAKRFPIS